MPKPTVADAQTKLSSALELIEKRGTGVNAGELALLNQVADKMDALSKVTVQSEPSVYRPLGEHSYLQDVLRSNFPGDPQHADAADRLRRHSAHVADQIAANTPYGRRALAQVGTQHRGANPKDLAREVRAMDSSSGSGGAFVTPAYLEDLWASFRSYVPAFLEALVPLRDPGYGLEVFIPNFTAGASAAVQSSENSELSLSTPTAGYLSSNLLTVGGSIEASQQLLDRAGPLTGSGSAFDTVAWQQLSEQHDAAADTAALSAMISNGGTIAGASTFSAAGLWSDVAAAASQIESLPGTVGRANAVFMTPAWFRFVSQLQDDNHRPLLVPAPATADLPLTQRPGFTGFKLAGLCVFEDGSIPEIAGTPAKTQFVVADLSAVYALQSAPSLRSFPEYGAQDLTAIVQRYSYLGVIARYPGAVSTVSGAGYVADPTFTA